LLHLIRRFAPTPPGEGFYCRKLYIAVFTSGEVAGVLYEKSSERVEATCGRQKPGEYDFCRNMVKNWLIKSSLVI
jgi:hypothetical protein